MGASGLSALVLFAAISFLMGPHGKGNRATAASAAAEAAPGDASTSDGRSPVPVVATADESARLTGEGAATTVPAGSGSDAGEPEVVARQPEVGGEAEATIAAPPPALRTFYVQYRDGAGALATQQVQAFDEAGARKVLRDFRGDPQILKGPATEVSW